MYNSQEEQRERTQVGGALVSVLNKNTRKAGGRFHGFVETVTLSLDLSSGITTDPHGPELFAETLVELVKTHDPFKTSSTRAGVLLDSPEMDEGVGISVQPISRIKVMDIVEAMGRMSQSNKSPLELDNPQVTARITYIQPPVGTGKRKLDTGDILDLSAFAKRPKHDNDCPPCDGPTNPKGIRSNIMPNEVTEDCLIHALYQALIHQEWKDNRSSENYKKYRDSIRKTHKRPKICQDVYKAVLDIKERSGISKSTNFDRVDIEQLQKTVFAGQYQIIVFVKNSTIPYYRGPYVENETRRQSFAALLEAFCQKLEEIKNKRATSSEQMSHQGVSSSEGAAISAKTVEASGEPVNNPEELENASIKEMSKEEKNEMWRQKSAALVENVRQALEKIKNREATSSGPISHPVVNPRGDADFNSSEVTAISDRTVEAEDEPSKAAGKPLYNLEDSTKLMLKDMERFVLERIPTGNSSGVSSGAFFGAKLGVISGAFEPADQRSEDRRAAGGPVYDPELLTEDGRAVFQKLAKIMSIIIPGYTRGGQWEEDYQREQRYWEERDGAAAGPSGETSGEGSGGAASGEGSGPSSGPSDKKRDN
ncbi:unnamed protein product [Caenorhabditis nigoni]